MRKGFSTIELLIAFAIMFLVLPPIMILAFGDQTPALDVSLTNGGVAALATQVRDAIASTTADWSSTPVPWTTEFYTQSNVTTFVSPCLKEVDVSVDWTSEHSRSQNASAKTFIANPTFAKALGGDCAAFPTEEAWSTPKRFSTHQFTPGKPVAMDVLDGVAYITDTKNNLQIYNATGDTFGNDASFSTTPYTDTEGKQINGIDVAKWIDPVTGAIKRYAYVTRNDTIGQFQVIDVTNPSTYTASPKITLGGTVPPTGSFPQGWRVFYFGNRAYVTTRETAGYEFHTMNVTTPMSPVEVGPGFEVNGTTNDLTVTTVIRNGTTYRVVFLATDRSANEIMALDVTNPTAAPVQRGAIDLPGTTDAYALQLLGDRLYVGRQTTPGNPELIIYKVNYTVVAGNLSVTFTQLGSAELNHNAVILRVAGPLAFIGNSSATTEFEVYTIQNPASVTRIDTTHVGLSNKTIAMDYETPYVYIASLTNDVLQVLYSAP